MHLSQPILTTDPPHPRYQGLIWDLIEHPESSTAANIVSYIAMSFVLISTVVMSLNTMQVISSLSSGHNWKLLSSVGTEGSGQEGKSSTSSLSRDDRGNLYCLVHTGVHYQVETW